MRNKEMAMHNKQLNNPFSIGGGCPHFETQRYGIIQLSDLQFGEKHRFENSSDFINKLQYDVRTMSTEYNFKPLYIVLSGDITEKARENEFQKAAEVLGKFADDLGIERIKILPIPGNHDVDQDLADKSKNINDDQLKFQPYNSFVSTITKSTECSLPKIINNRLDIGISSGEKSEYIEIEFLLLNSCEREDSSCHDGYVCQEKLQTALNTQEKKEKLKIAILHHSLYPTYERSKGAEKNLGIINTNDIDSILTCNSYNIILTGHLHNADINTHKNKNYHEMIVANCGSTGVNKDGREDGIQNQYCIHIIDLSINQLESIWRAYSPSTQTIYGMGGWIPDSSFGKTNPTKFPLPILKHEQIVDTNTLKYKQATGPKGNLSGSQPAIETKIARANFFRNME
ncbi:MAG: metallophosphoesterase family protein [Sedimentisphaerales bacterium]